MKIVERVSGVQMVELKTQGTDFIASQIGKNHQVKSEAGIVTTTYVPGWDRKERRFGEICWREKERKS